MFCSSFCSLKQGKQFGFQPSACFTVKINTKISQREFRLKGTPLTCLLRAPRSSCFAQVVPLAAAQYIVQLCPRAKAITGLRDKSSYSEIWQGGYFWHLVSSGSQDEVWLGALTLSCLPQRWRCYITQSRFLTPLPLSTTLLLTIPI